MPELTQVNPII